MKDPLNEVNIPIDDLAGKFCERLWFHTEEDITVPIDGTGQRLINKEYAEALAYEMLAFTAEVIAILINAGSEREAVMENDELFQQLWQEVNGWSNDPKNGSEA